MGKRELRKRLSAALAGALALAAGGARARPVDFDIPDQPREAAVMALSRQAGLSVGFATDAHCGGRAALAGRMEADEALQRLLAGSGCLALRPDARTIVIRPRPATSRAAPPRSAVAPPPSPLDEVVVTAEKQIALISEAASGLTVATGRELDRAGASDMEDISLLAAGVSVTNLGPGRNKVQLRGLSDGPLTGHAQSTVGLYLGELRLTYNAPDPDLPLLDVDRVEVLRGPQGSLYGAGSIGGVVQVIPNAPDPTAPAVSAGARLAAARYGAPSAELNGMVNLPLPLPGRAAVRWVGWAESAGGYIDNPRRHLKDINRTGRIGARGILRWEATEEVAIEMMGVVQSISTRNAHYAEPSVGSLAHATLLSEPHDNDFHAAALTARWTPSWGRLVITVGALDHDVSTTYDATRAPADLVAAGARPSRFMDDNEIRGLLTEARLSSTGIGRLHWTIGGFNATGHQTLNSGLGAFGGAPAYMETRRDHLSESAVFGETAYDLTRRLTLIAGGRVFRSDLRVRSDIALGAPVRSFSARTDSGGFAPKLVMAYRPARGLTVYAQAAEGFRAPGFNTGGGPGQAFGDLDGAQPLRRYLGDQLRSYEAGARWRDRDRGVAARVALFQADWRHIQAEMVLPSGLPFTANLGDGRSRGLEFEGGLERGPWQLSGNLVLQQPRLRRPAPGLTGMRTDGLPGASIISFATMAAYDRPLSARWRLDLVSSFTFVGRSTLAFAPSQRARMGSYGDLRLAATLRSSRLQLRAYVENALDRRGDTLAFGNPFAFRTTPETTPQRPRTVGVAVERWF